MKDEKKIRVANKLGLAGDLAESKIQTTVQDVRMIDGKISASFAIDGLPVDKNYKGDYWERSHKRIPKIFNTFSEFTAYAEDFFSKSDEDIINLCKEK